MKTPLGLVQICTLPQGATNSVAHMQNAMNQILKDFVKEKTIPFVNDIPIKGCEEAKRDSTVQDNGCRIFVNEHIKDVDYIQGCLLCRDGPCSVTTSRQNRHDDGTTSCRTLSLP